MIEISPKSKKLPNDLENLESYKKWPQSLKVNETPLKPKNLVTFPQNLQNDWNTLRISSLMNMPSKHPKYPKPLIWLF